MFAGMTAPEFDLLYAKVAKKHPKMDRKRLSAFCQKRPQA